jgi:hypothetical protein
MLARQLGHRLPAAVTNGLWQWSKRARLAGTGHERTMRTSTRFRGRLGAPR